MGKTHRMTEKYEKKSISKLWDLCGTWADMDKLMFKLRMKTEPMGAKERQSYYKNMWKDLKRINAIHF